MLRRFRIVLIVLVVVIGGIVLLAVTRLRETEQPDSRLVESRALWDSNAVQNYQLGMDIFAGAMIPIGLNLTVQNGDIAQTSYVACDSPTARHPAANCDVIQRYYSDTQGYTVEQLFETASTCMTDTRRLLNTCNPTAAANFTSFSTADDMIAAVQNCPSDIGAFCAVEYDPIQGFPKTIWQYTPQVADGFRIVSVTGFEAAAP